MSAAQRVQLLWSEGVHIGPLGHLAAQRHRTPAATTVMQGTTCQRSDAAPGASCLHLENGGGDSSSERCFRGTRNCRTFATVRHTVNYNCKEQDN